VHNCDLFYGHAGSDGDQAKGDGAMDSKGSKYVTISYNHFWDTGKSNLLGLSEKTTVDYYITYHHNWYDHSDSRHPRVRYYSAHVYNNYYDGISKYGVGSTMGSSVFVENNFFRNCKYPMLISMQGSDIINGTGTFSSEDGGIIKAFNNTMSGQARFVPYHAVNYPVEFDAYVASARDEIVSSTIKSKKGGNSYNNFDTDANFYVKNLVVDAPEVARDRLMQYSGRVQGGDFNWTFNNAVDDTSYDVNPALKSALLSYSTKLVAVQGESSSASSSQTLTSTGNNNQTVNEGTPIEPIVFTWGGDANDAIVIGLPALGISFVKNSVEKTITISGTPTGTVSYAITTSGTVGIPVSASGAIMVAGSDDDNSETIYIHNFTADGKTNPFYSITGNLSTQYGVVNYDDMTLTQCLKMESSTNISFTTTQVSTLTLVFNKSYSGDIKINGVIYKPASTPDGIVVIDDLPAGTHTILKGSGSSYLFYISTVYNMATNVNQAEIVKVDIFPNPVSDRLNITSESALRQIEIYTLTGQLLQQISGNVPNIDFASFSKGNYLLRITTDNGTISKMIIKK
jgi:pectate lyase